MTERGPEVYQQAMQAALRLLRGRDLTVTEINTRLLTKGFDARQVEGVVASLVRQGHVKDSRIAERAVELAKGERPKGRLRLEMELKARGASLATIQEAMGSLTPENERTAAQAEAERVKGRGGDLQKAAARLSAKGFDEDAIASVLEEVFGFEPGL